MEIIAVGAQTERRGDAWPVRGLLGGKDLTGRFLVGSEAECQASPQPPVVWHLADLLHVRSLGAA